MKNLKIKTENKQLISRDIAYEYQIIPFDYHEEANQLFVYVPEKLNALINTQEINIITGYNCYIEFIPDNQFSKLLNKTYPKSQKAFQSQSLKASDDFLQKIIHLASDIHSSDIHIEAFEKQGRVRYRIDGKLVEQFIIPKHEYPSLINQIKIAAQLDISEKRLPQDGRITIENVFQKFDIRVSILPTLHGEKIVLRLLSKENIKIELSSLGFTDDEAQTFKNYIQKSNGIVLVSGPTGSGKTTTLYAALKELNHENNNILTVEDPIEYTIEGINQVQLKENIGLDFSKVLRSFLRQDPDIIMVGEIRDVDTANIAIRAALTGHLVLSTIHTNSAWATIARLIDMGIAPYLIADTLVMSVAQRLVRKLCNHCKEETPIEKPYSELELLKNITTSYQPTGCEHCFYTGYSGRKAIYEIIPITLPLVEHIKNNPKDNPFHLFENHKTLQTKALDLLQSGETSLQEIYTYLI